MELTKCQRIALSNAKLLGQSLYAFIGETDADLEDVFNNLKWTLSSLDPEIAGSVVQYTLRQILEGQENLTPFEVDDEGYFVISL